jgi:hypothetical protein
VYFGLLAKKRKMKKRQWLKREKIESKTTQILSVFAYCLEKL